MAKKVKIREIKPKIKIVKELGKEKDEIEDIVSEEIPLSQDEVAGIVDPAESLVLGGEQAIPGEFGGDDLETSAGREEGLSSGGESIARFYSGIQKGALYKSLTMEHEGGAEPEYKPVENIETDMIRQSSVGRDFSMSQGGGGTPEEQFGGAVQDRMREEQRDNKYDPSKMEQDGKKKGKRYAWET